MPAFAHCIIVPLFPSLSPSLSLYLSISPSPSPYLREPPIIHSAHHSSTASAAIRHLSAASRGQRRCGVEKDTRVSFGSGFAGSHSEMVLFPPFRFWLFSHPGGPGWGGSPGRAKGPVGGVPRGPYGPRGKSSSHSGFAGSHSEIKRDTRGPKRDPPQKRPRIVPKPNPRGTPQMAPNLFKT